MTTCLLYASEFGEVEPRLAAERLQSDSTALNNHEFSLFSESNNLKPQSASHLQAFTPCHEQTLSYFTVPYFTVGNIEATAPERRSWQVDGEKQRTWWRKSNRWDPSAQSPTCCSVNRGKPVKHVD